MRLKDPRRATTYHEAGHAVVALMLRRPITHLSINPDTSSTGHFQPQRSREAMASDDVERRRTIKVVIVDMAGMAAEARLLLGPTKRRANNQAAFLEAIETGGTGDIHHALFGLTKYWQQPFLDGKLEASFGIAYDLTGLGWPAVQALADEVLQRRSGILTGRDIRSIVRGTPSPWFSEPGANHSRSMRAKIRRRIDDVCRLTAGV